VAAWLRAAARWWGAGFSIDLMCGIYGFCGFSDERLGARMAARIVHRGPDGSGRFSAPGIEMGMQRLAIIDLEGGWQPVYNEDRSLAVVYNGEIYNYLELREELQARGHVFSTRSDTEVIVHGYEEWGEDCVTRFNGMFAFALHDRRSGETFFARDRSGQKPFYYWQDGRGRLVFASEVKALLECPLVPRACNVAAIDPYLALRVVPEPQTMFKDIFTLPAAHRMTRKADGSLKTGRYWEIRLKEDRVYPSDAEAVEQVEAGLRQAVKLVMRSDVPVGAYLSAGIDSSLLVALMCEHNNQVNTFSIGFNSPIDETRDAAETARLLGTRHHTIHCAPEDFDLLPQVIYQMDRPVGDALIIAFDKLAGRTSQDLKVVVGGEGADEIFAGYSFHKLMPLVEAYHRAVPAFLHRGLALPALRLTPDKFLNLFFNFPADLGKEGKARLVEFMAHYRERDLFRNYVALKTLWGREARARLYADDFKVRATEDWVPPVRDPGGRFLDRLLKLQWDEWLQDWAIIRQDKNTMAHSLEIRLPFLDHNLIELGFTLNPDQKVRKGRDKWIEREVAARLLPPPVVNRPKNPFFFPLEFFYEHPQINRLIADTLHPEVVKKRGYFRPEAVSALVARMPGREFVTLKQVMSLVILELWHRVFIDPPSWS
jgi:asparagine synthase (glutamine-hydrolysing)